MINPDLARTIDREIGSKICWILTQVAKAIKKKKQPRKPVRKILFVKMTELGSSVLLYPSFKHAKKLFPGAEVYFLTLSRNQEIFEIMGIPKTKIITIELNLYKLPFELCRIIRRLRKEKFDVVIDFEFFSRFSAILGFLSGAPLLSGFYKFHLEGLYRGDLITHKVIYNPHIHTALGFLSLVQAVKEDPTTPLSNQQLVVDLCLPRFKPRKAEVESVWQKIKAQYSEIKDKKLVVFNTHASNLIPQRHWPQESFAKLAKRLLRDKKIIVILIGSPVEVDYVNRVERLISHERCINLSGQTSLRELLTLFTLSHLLISNDGGPVHLAALTPIYILSLFGIETPRLYAPLTSRNISITPGFASVPSVSAYDARKSAFSDNLPMQKISVDFVLKYAKMLLAKPVPKISDETFVKAQDLLQMNPFGVYEQRKIK